jgi:hypothetical protein
VHCPCQEHQVAPQKIGRLEHKDDIHQVRGGIKAYQADDTCTGCVHVTRDIVFDELAQWDWGEDGDANGKINTKTFKIVFITTEYQMVSDVN